MTSYYLKGELEEHLDHPTSYKVLFQAHDIPNFRGIYSKLYS